MQKNETESPLLSAFSQGILTLTFNRPEARNALSPEITSGLIVALEEAQRDADVRAVGIVGEAKARELLMFSPVLGADEAHALGLLHQVHDDEALQQAATSWIETLAQGPTLAYGHIKKALLASSLNGLSTQLDVESGLQVLCQSTEDHKEAAIAFVEKRAARFQGR
ncbi:MAG: hypothetical protein EBZ03_09400 [Betaproteobacteria bacterium]|nr:hypothetical protein [Betaproteobacteria bacterium]